MTDNEVFDLLYRNVKHSIHSTVGDEVSFECPKCRDDGHFSVNITKQVFYCFKCHYSGSIKQEIRKNSVMWSEILAIVGDTYLPPCPGRYPAFCSLAGSPIMESEGGYVFIKDGAEKAGRYCLDRGMTRQQIYDYKVYTKEYDGRVYFPYWNEKGEITFWIGRATNNLTEPKTLTMPGSECPLFGRHVKKYTDEVVLVEGVFDHFATPNSYAIMGSNVTGNQILQLKVDDVKKIFIIFDPDAHEQSERVAKKLANFGFDVFPVMLSGDQDPAEIGRKRMTELVESIKHNNCVKPTLLHAIP